jgi:hypothetical protein
MPTLPILHQPFATFLDHGHRWRCNMCNLTNDVPKLLTGMQQHKRVLIDGSDQSSIMPWLSSSLLRNIWLDPTASRILISLRCQLCFSHEWIACNKRTLYLGKLRPNPECGSKDTSWLYGGGFEPALLLDSKRWGRKWRDKHAGR